MRLFVSLTVTCLILAASTSCADDDQEGIDFFEKNIRPVLVKRCYKCHSADSEEAKGGLLLDSRDGIRRGGESGHAVVPGDLSESLILGAIKHETFEMPPEEPLPPAVVRNFEKWIRMGAPDPREGKAPLIQREIDFEKAREHWAYRPITKTETPDLQDAWENWPVSDIDRFIAAKLQEHELAPVGDADPSQLVRRVYFDLTGLPPTPEQVDEFVTDPSEEALEALIDELLDSPRFGERWGRHWLDVVRFAESTGMERNFTYPHAWRYRDYVIESFNRDKPFDQFLREQIAGDLLPGSSARDKEQQLAATGVLAVGTKLLNERDKDAFQMEIVDDQIDVVSRAFLGLTASCARCHDHKFDPIPQKEYYALAGIFCSTDTHYGTVSQNGNRQPGSLIALRGEQVGAVSTGKSNNKKTANLTSLNRQLKSQQKRIADLKKRKTQNASTKKQIAAAEKRVRTLRKQISEHEAAGVDKKDDGAKPTLLMGTLEGGTIGDTQLRIRGEPRDKGETIPRGFLTIATLSEPPAIPEKASGREQLADWLLDDSNPLTARVAANRIWQHLFGRGIVPTVNNFGRNGTPPSHPELLDYLAVRLRSNGWSWKQTIREIMLSRVYRLGTEDNDRALEIDPDNHLLWRMNQRRLEVEAIRDAMLAASGRLDLAPMQGSVVATIGDGNVGRGIDPSKLVMQSFKRSVYLPIVRSAVPEMLRIFDFPEPSIIGGQRDVTTVPTQALYMMNSEFVTTQSDALARRVLAEQQDDADRIAQAYLLTLARRPSAGETEVALDFIERAGELAEEEMPEEQRQLRGWSGFCQALLASAEFRYLD